MDLTTATHVSFNISNSVKEEKFVKSVAPLTSRVKKTKEYVNDKQKTKKGFFTPNDRANFKEREQEQVSGTTWRLRYKINSLYHDIHQHLTTKELKAFILSDVSGSIPAREASAITAIDTALDLSDSHANKYATYNGLQYNILELMTRINKSAIFEDTEIGNQAKQFVVFATDQTENNAAHQAREALKEQYDGSEDSLVYMRSLGINI